MQINLSSGPTSGDDRQNVQNSKRMIIRFDTCGVSGSSRSCFAALFSDSVKIDRTRLFISSFVLLFTFLFVRRSCNGRSRWLMRGQGITPTRCGCRDTLGSPSATKGCAGSSSSERRSASPPVGAGALLETIDLTRKLSFPWPRMTPRPPIHWLCRL